MEEVQLDSEVGSRKLVADITAALPTYLNMWSSEFQDESLVVLDSMYQVVCANAKNDYDTVTRECMLPLFKKSNAEISTYEALSSNARYTILGILRLLGRPSRTVLKELSVLSAMEGPADSFSDGGIYGLCTRFENLFP